MQLSQGLWHTPTVTHAHVVNANERKYRKEKIDLEATFKPNLLNSAVYVMSMALQVSTFAVNYRVYLVGIPTLLPASNRSTPFKMQGRPFMESLAENRPMLISVVGSGMAVFALASNLLPEMSE